MLLDRLNNRPSGYAETLSDVFSINLSRRLDDEGNRHVYQRATNDMSIDHVLSILTRLVHNGSTETLADRLRSELVQTQHE